MNHDNMVILMWRKRKDVELRIRSQDELVAMSLTDVVGA
jgi:hypothetical protein